MMKSNKCVGSGIHLARWAKEDPVIFPENVRGYARPEDLTVPYSELAMHTRAAGRPILAWACRRDGRSCAVVFEESDGGCGFVSGLASEVLTPEVRRAMQKVLGYPTGFGAARRR